MYGNFQTGQSASRSRIKKVPYRLKWTQLHCYENVVVKNAEIITFHIKLLLYVFLFYFCCYTVLHTLFQLFELQPAAPRQPTGSASWSPLVQVYMYWLDQTGVWVRIPKNVKLFVVVHKSCRNGAKQSNIKLDFHNNSNAKIVSNVVIVQFTTFHTSTASIQSVGSIRYFFQIQF